MVAELLEKHTGVALMVQSCIAGSGFLLNDDECRVNPFLPLEPVLISLCPEVIDVIECNLVQVTDARIEIAWDGNI